MNAANAGPESERMLALISFTRRFSAMVDVGVSLVRAMSVLERDVPYPYNGAALEVNRDVQAGATLSAAMEKRPDLFPPFYTRMVRAGEYSGVLEEALGYVADLLEEAYRIWSVTGKRDAWAGLVLPSDRPMPEDWSALSERERKAISMFFCCSMAMMLSAGVPINLSLEIAADVLPAVQRQQVRAIIPMVGPDSGTAPLDKIDFAPEFAGFMVRFGAEYGRLEVIFDKIAEVYRHELQCELI